MRVTALCVLVVVLPASPAAAQQDFVLKAVCIGGAHNTATEVTASADGTISRRRYYRATGKGKSWHILGRDPARVRNWLETVDATELRRNPVPGARLRSPCNVPGERPCHLVRRKGETDYYACRAESVLKEMLDFNEGTGKPQVTTEALQVVEQWTKAFLKADVDALVKLHAPDALFMGTDSKEPVSDPTEIRRYFENAFSIGKPRDVITTQENMALSDDVVLVAGTSVSTSVVAGEPVADRVTFVIAKRGTEWLIVHFHASAMPR
jgi:uncharacterized protein (TIGR02246 family)